MNRESAGVAVVLGMLAVACTEGGTVLPVEAGESDATETHDVVFVSQVDDDAPDDAMEWDGSPGPSDAGATEGAVQLGEPTFAPAAGTTLIPGDTVTILPPADFPAGGSLFYTLDGSAPTHQSGRYVGPVQILGTFDGGCGPGSATVEALASAPGFVDSVVAVASYPVASPQSGNLPVVAFSQQSSTQNNDFPLGLSYLPGATLCYSLDGVTTPVCTASAACVSPALTYTGPIGITGAVPANPATGSVTVTAIACGAAGPPFCGPASTEPVSQTYLLQAAPPTMTNPAPGTAASGVMPTLSTATVASNEPVSIHMTTGATPPSCGTGTVLPGSSTVGPFTTTTTVNALACKTGYLPSSVVTFVYTIP